MLKLRDCDYTHTRRIESGRFTQTTRKSNPATGKQRSHGDLHASTAATQDPFVVGQRQLAILTPLTRVGYRRVHFSALLTHNNMEHQTQGAFDYFKDKWTSSFGMILSCIARYFLLL
ncbi:hypothetical protein TNCT_673061 [Trichonephila clavata]|uniref:Uncharacterized protein n=1 Tax=Trichonephila clavata TaxID=2740835 RepID=A0A8X6GTJ0_TRICU|nr:hypothetical protein TNCT_673061 [Trichonephila clavata]